MFFSDLETTPFPVPRQGPFESTTYQNHTDFSLFFWNLDVQILTFVHTFLCFLESGRANLKFHTDFCVFFLDFNDFGWILGGQAPPKINRKSIEHL